MNALSVANRPWRNGLLLCLGLAAAAAMAGVPQRAEASHTTIRIQGDRADNAFRISVTNATSSIQVCSAPGVCVSYTRSALDAILVEGFEGDDILTIHHGDDIVTENGGDLPITFAAGTGADRVVICDTTCGSTLSTSYAPGATADEMRLVQQLGTRRMTLITTDVGEVDDRSRGDVTVHGSASDDVITYSAPPSGGRVAVNVLTPYLLTTKRSVTLSTGSGADRVTVERAGGLASAAACPGASSPVCVRADDGVDDRLAVAATDGSSESVRLEPRGAGSGRLTGLAGAPDVDVAGIDAVTLSVQDGEDDLTLRTGGGADAVEVAVAQGGPLRLTGEVDRGSATPYALPLVEVDGVGPAGTALRVEAGDGADSVAHLPAGGDEVIDLRPAGGGGTLCPAFPSDCLAVSSNGQPVYQLAAVGVETSDISGGDGNDTLRRRGDVGAATTWRGGTGTDTVRFEGTGSLVAVDLGAGTLTQGPTDAQPAPGLLTATATEALDVRAAGRAARVVGTAADDLLTVTPTGPAAAAVTLAGDPRSLTLADAAVVVAEPGAGADDRVEILATAGADTVSVARGAELAVTVGSWVPVRAGAGTEAAVLRGREGNDEVFVSGSGAPASLTVDGGPDAAGDRLAVAQPLLDAAVMLDAVPNAGTVVGAGTVVFTGLEVVDLEGDGGASRLSVAGSDGRDTLTQQGNAVSGSGTTVRFSRFPEVALASGAGDDATRVAPTTTSGVTLLRVDGGSSVATGDQLTVVASGLGETVSYRPTGTAAGRVEVAGGPPVVFGSTESVLLDGATVPPGGDRLVVETPTLDGTLVLTPGATFDSGEVAFLDAAGAATGMPPLTFGSLGAGSVELAGPAQADTFVQRGSLGRDTFDVAVEPAGTGSTGVVRLNGRVPVRTPGVHTLRLEGGDDADTFRLPSAHPYLGAAGVPAVHVDGGGPDAADTLRVRGSGAVLTADVARAVVQEAGFAAVAHSGLADVHLEAAGGAVTVLGTTGPDALVYTPTAAAGARLATGAEPVLVVSGVGSPLLVDAREGADRVSLEARTVADNVSVVRGATTEVTVAGLLPLRVPGATEALDVRAGDGEDVLTVAGAGGPVSLTLDGGLPAGAGDRLELMDRTVGVTFATDPSSGRLLSSGGPVSFLAIEVLAPVGDGSGTLTVAGTGSGDSISIGAGPVPAVKVNGGADVAHRGYPTIVMEGGGGQDLLSVSFGGLGDARTVRAVGGDPALGDRVVAHDRFGTSTTFTATPTGAGEARVTLDPPAAVLEAETVESVLLDGRLGDDQFLLITPTGAQDVRVDPDDTLADAGSFRVGSLVPIAFQQFGATVATVVDADGGRPDRLIVDGSEAGDRFTVTRDRGEVRLAGWLPVVPASAVDVTLQGLGGDDEFDVIGPLPYRTAVLDGGSPDDGDALRMVGPSGSVTVDLNARSVTGYGGTILFPGMFVMHTDVGGQTLTEVGTARDDAVCYDPQAPRDGRLYLVGAPAGGTASSACYPDLRSTNVLHTFVDVARLLVDPGAGADEVIVNGSVDRDVVTVHATFPETEVTVHPAPEQGGTFRLPVAIAVATAESVVVASDSGSDSIDVTAYNNQAPRFTVYGESPSTKLTGDEMVVRDGSGRAHMHTTTSHTAGDGTVTATYRSTGIQVRVDYHGVEKVTTLRDSKEA